MVQAISGSRERSFWSQSELHLTKLVCLAAPSVSFLLRVRLWFFVDRRAVWHPRVRRELRPTSLG